MTSVGAADPPAEPMLGRNYGLFAGRGEGVIAAAPSPAGGR
jgi:hypothetical protein